VAKQLEAEIRERSPGNGRALAALQERHAALKQRISAVDAAYTSTIGGAKQKTIVVAHDAYGWLAKRYGLRVVPLAGLTAQEPKPSAIAAAINAVKKEGVPVVFAEPQLPKGPMQRVATQTGAKLGMIDPLGDGDWFKLMESNLAAIAEALQAARP
jgi:zinc transport system substrate-binding protein